MRKLLGRLNMEIMDPELPTQKIGNNKEVGGQIGAGDDGDPGPLTQGDDSKR